MGILKATESICYSSEQFRGITYVKEVADSIPSVIRLPGGAYNYGSETTKSMHEITMDFLGLIDKKIRLDDSSSQRNLWINCEKARKYGVLFSSVEDGLKKCAKDYGLI